MERDYTDCQTASECGNLPAIGPLSESHAASQSLFTPARQPRKIVVVKIYTRTGDDGSTGLFSGERVHKSDPRLDCYGTVDELNAALGLALCAAPLMAEKLRAVQNELFVIGSHLATPEHSPHAAKLPPMDDSAISRLEME